MNPELKQLFQKCLVCENIFRDAEGQKIIKQVLLKVNLERSGAYSLNELRFLLDCLVFASLKRFPEVEAEKIETQLRRLADSMEKMSAHHGRLGC